MIKMFCLKDQKKTPLAPVSAAAARYYCCRFSFFDVVFLLFFPPSVTGEYDLRKGEREK